MVESPSRLHQSVPEYLISLSSDAHNLRRESAGRYERVEEVLTRRVIGLTKELITTNNVQDVSVDRGG
jgi:hypothetical protein